MSLQTFFDNFALLADAPNGVAKLRELILQLAVEGKLVSQNPHDEPGSLLFERITKQRERLIKEKKIQKPKVLPPISAGDLSFDLPLGWHVTRLGHVFDFTYGKSLPEKVRNSNGKIPVYGSNGIVGFHDEALVNEPSLIVGRKGSSGAVNIANEPFFPIDTTYYVIPPKGVDLRFSYFLIRSLNLVKLDKATAIPGLNRQDAYVLPIALPPVEEQRRIVAKVDELMRLCDELEARQQERRESRVRLNNATLAPLNKAASLAPEEFERASARLAANFATLYDSAETVGKLRSTILQLAVQGRLVKQNPDNEPASALLEILRNNKANLLNEKGMKRTPEDLFHEEQSPEPYSLPRGWQWCAICDFAIVRGGKRLPKGVAFSPSVTPHVYVRVTNMKNGTILRHDLKYIDENVFQQIKQYAIEKDDVYVTIAGTIGQSGEVPDFFHGMNLTENAAKLMFRGLNKHYLLIALQSKTIQDQFTAKTNKMAQPKLALKRIASALVPLPPTEEQKRIVAEVNQLMALCDELETKLRQADIDSEKLMNAAVQHVLASITDRSTNILAGVSA
jgi:type I restriction enzyme S subunit